MTRWNTLKHTYLRLDRKVSSTFKKAACLEDLHVVLHCATPCVLHRMRYPIIHRLKLYLYKNKERHSFVKCCGKDSNNLKYKKQATKTTKTIESRLFHLKLLCTRTMHAYIYVLHIKWRKNTHFLTNTAHFSENDRPSSDISLLNATRAKYRPKTSAIHTTRDLHSRSVSCM